MKRLLFLFFAFFFAAHSKAQQKPISQSLLLHLNKNTCNTGDSLRFKCYIINSVDHVQEDNNLYVVLSDESGKFISKNKYPIFNSSAFGTIPIPKELPSGVCNIEAFTAYMINHNVVKVNQVMVNNTVSGADTAAILCKVYYDNNRLVSRMPNTFYIKTHYPGSIPVACEVVLNDNDNNRVNQFFTDVNGVAKITFVPLKNKVYSLSIKNHNKTYKFPLLQPDSNGVNMQVSFDSNIVYYQVNKNYALQKSQDVFTVTASQKNEVVYSSEFSFENYSTITGGLNVGGLHTGMLKLALVNKEGITVSTTSIYLQNGRDFEQVSLKIPTDPAENKAHFNVLLASKTMKFFSIAAENTDLQAAAETDDLDFFYSNLLNNPDVNSVVDFYELHTVKNKAAAGNYKIITANKRVLPDSEPLLKLNDEYATTIKGKVYDGNNEKLLSNGTLKISYEEMGKPLDYSINIKPDGTFLLDSLVFYGKNKFYYHYYDRNNNEISCRIKLMENENNKILDSLMVSRFNYKPQPKINAEVNNDANAKPAAAISPTATGKDKKQNVNDLYTTGIYSGQSSSFIDNINFPSGDGSIPGTDFVKNRIQNVAVQNGNLVNTKNFSMQQSQFWVIGIMIDELPVSFSELALLTSKDIALVKFFDAGHASTGMNNPGGLIAVYTKNKITNRLPGKKEDATTLQVFEYEGFSNYLNSAVSKVSSSNTTGLVYWNPSVILAKDQNTFSFETEKLKPGTAYKIRLKGYNELGQLINFEKVFKN